MFKAQQLFTVLIASLTEWLNPMYITVLYDHPETFESLSGKTVKEAEALGMDLDYLSPVIDSSNVVFGPPSTSPETSSTPTTNPSNPVSPKKALLFSNHQTYLDWWLIWQLAYEFNHHGHLKIVLKDTLKSIPIFGWGMTFFEFIFLNRKWNVDKSRLSSSLQTATTTDASLPLWLLIFPEGTIIDANTRSTSQGYAEKNHLPYPYNHVIMPKSTGLEFMLKELTTANPSFDPCQDFALYDVTLAYPPRTTSPNQLTSKITFPTLDYTLSSVFFQLQGPRHFHLLIRKINWKPVSPLDSTSFNNWLNDRYLEKDQVLSQFYKPIHDTIESNTFTPRGSPTIENDNLFKEGFPRLLKIPTIKDGKHVHDDVPTLAQTIIISPTLFDKFLLLTNFILMFRLLFYIVYLLGIEWTYRGLFGLIATLLTLITSALIYTGVLKLE